MKIWLARPKFFGQEIHYLQEAFQTNWIGTVGGQKTEFTEEIKGFLNYQSGINLLNSGTAALHIALQLADVKENEYVLCSTLTFVASANAIKYQKAHPIFIDSDAKTGNMCPDLLAKALVDLQTQGIKPKALVLVHAYGVAAQIDKIMSICTQYQIQLIEDAAGAFGSKSNTQYVGTFGDFGVFSLNANKIITGASGGILLSKNIKHQEKIDYLIAQAKSKINPNEHHEIGYNYGMTNLSAAVARAQLQSIHSILEEKHTIFERYAAKFGDKITGSPTSNTDNHWLSCMFFDTEVQKKKVFEALQQAQIESRYIWKPMHLQELYKDCKHYTNGNSEAFSLKGLCLPSDINMSTADQEKVIQIIQHVLRE